MGVHNDELLITTFKHKSWLHFYDWRWVMYESCGTYTDSLILPFTTQLK
jgi:hypothetical protein